MGCTQYTILTRLQKDNAKMLSNKQQSVRLQGPKRRKTGKKLCFMAVKPGYIS